MCPALFKYFDALPEKSYCQFKPSARAMSMNEGTTAAPGSAYRDALAVTAEASDSRLAQAEAILQKGNGAVLLEGVLALRREAGYLYCEVLDPAPSSHRCEQEYQVLIENAHGLLEASRLGRRLPSLPRVWLVVEDRGTHVVEIWHEA